jgi:hypothetical protein
MPISLTASSRIVARASHSSLRCPSLREDITLSTASRFWIYREQSGGTQAVRTDRKQRRARLREALCELKADNDQDPQLRKLAATTLELLGNLQ